MPIIILAVLGLANMLCTLPFSDGKVQEDLPATIEALQAELESWTANLPIPLLEPPPI